MRTYVCDQEGNKGVWFYSLDSSDLLGFGERLLYGLRYNFARIERKGSSTDRNLIYSGNRGEIATSRIEANWEEAQSAQSTPGSLDHFLLERYRFWARRAFARRSSSAFVRHIPYQAVRVQNSSYKGGLFASQGFAEPMQEPDLGHYCSGFTVEATAPEWAFSFPARQTKGKSHHPPSASQRRMLRKALPANGVGSPVPSILSAKTTSRHPWRVHWVKWLNCQRKVHSVHHACFGKLLRG